MHHELYLNQASRNLRAKELKTEGKRVYRRTTGPCELHPMYIKDYGRSLSDEEKGFGNTLYKSYFANLYYVEWED